MSIMPVRKFASDTTRITTRLVETTIKEVWSKLDAAAEKPRPSEYLGRRAIRAVQGHSDLQQ